MGRHTYPVIAAIKQLTEYIGAASRAQLSAAVLRIERCHILQAGGGVKVDRKLREQLLLQRLQPISLRELSKRQASFRVKDIGEQVAEQRHGALLHLVAGIIHACDQHIEPSGLTDVGSQPGGVKAIGLGRNEAKLSTGDF